MSRKKSVSEQNIQRYMRRSYLFIAYISVFIEIILCAYMILSANRSAKRNRDEALTGIVYQMDGIWKNIQERTNQVSRDALAAEILYSNAVPAYHGEEVLKVQSLMELFQKEKETYQEIQEMYLVDPDQDTVISSSSIFHGKDADQALTDLRLDKSLFDRVDFTAKAVLNVTGEEDAAVCYLQGIFGRSYQEPDGYLVTRVNISCVDERLELLNPIPGEEVYFISAEGHRIGGDSTQAELYETVRGENDQSFTVRSRGKRYVAAQTPSAYMGIVYYYAASIASNYRLVYVTAGFTLATLVILLGLSYLFARKFTLENIAPLRKIMDTLQNTETSEEQFTYSHMMEGASRLVHQVGHFEEQKRQHMLSQIIGGQIRKQDEIEEYQRQFAPEAEQGFYVLCACLAGELEAVDYDLKVFCISNVFGEVLEEFLLLRPVENWDRVYFLVSEKSETLTEKVKYACRYVKERLSIEAECGFSERLDSLTLISYGKAQADYMVNYGMMRQQEDHTMWYEELIRTDQTVDDGYSGRIKRILNLVMVQDYAGALQDMKELWDTEFSGPDVDAEAVKTRLLTIMTVVSIPHREKFGKKEFVPKEKWNSLSVIYGDLCEMLTELQAERDDGKNQSRKTFEKMRDYILQHATESDITAKSVADAFALTNSYASSMFKKYAGDGILDYIHKERIRQAKQWLLEGRTVQEAAELAGYLDARSFIRTFKKYEGITPGQFKDM